MYWDFFRIRSGGSIELWVYFSKQRKLWLGMRAWAWAWARPSSIFMFREMLFDCRCQLWTTTDVDDVDVDVFNRFIFRDGFEKNFSNQNFHSIGKRTWNKRSTFAPRLALSLSHSLALSLSHYLALFRAAFAWNISLSHSHSLGLSVSVYTFLYHVWHILPLSLSHPAISSFQILSLANSDTLKCSLSPSLSFEHALAREHQRRVKKGPTNERTSAHRSLLSVG